MFGPNILAWTQPVMQSWLYLEFSRQGQVRPSCLGGPYLAIPGAQNALHHCTLLATDCFYFMGQFVSHSSAFWVELGGPWPGFVSMKLRHCFEGHLEHTVGVPWWKVGHRYNLFFLLTPTAYRHLRSTVCCPHGGVYWSSVKIVC
jgi:hypothetical protein